jgi:hypothetical protein
MRHTHRCSLSKLDLSVSYHHDSGNITRIISSSERAECTQRFNRNHDFRHHRIVVYHGQNSAIDPRKMRSNTNDRVCLWRRVTVGCAISDHLEQRTYPKKAFTRRTIASSSRDLCVFESFLRYIKNSFAQDDLEFRRQL